MKKRNNLLRKAGAAVAFTALVFLAPSCKKYTNLLPENALATVNAFDTKQHIEESMIGVYFMAANGNYNNTGDPRGYPFGAASIEQSEMRGEDMVNLQAFYQITYQSQISSSTPNNSNIWISCYQLINQANTFIDGVHTALANGVLTTAQATAYEGEARFLRALAHHELVVNMSRPYLDNAGNNPGVPYRTLAINSQAAVAQGSSQDRGTVAQDYTAILADLDYAETNLPATNAANSITRATKGAAIALKTRIKLHMGDWAGVITEGTKLGATGAGPYTSPIGSYALTATPDGPFASLGANASNSESIFSIEQGPQASPSVNGALASMFGIGSLGGRDLICTSPNLYNAPFWVSSDTRRTTLQILNTNPSYPFYFNYKYRDNKTFSDYAPIIRYAEVLLNVAEANSRTNLLPQAFNLLNAVRNRAVATADRYAGGTFPTSLSMTQAILNERRIEFAGEGRRWEDISRLALDANFSPGGIPAKVLYAQMDATSFDIVNRPMITPGFAAIAYSNFKFVWPIPDAEIAANPVLAKEQNPFY